MQATARIPVVSDDDGAGPRDRRRAWPALGRGVPMVARQSTRGEHTRALRAGRAVPALTRDSQLVSLDVAAEAFGVSVKTIRRRIAEGRVAGYRIGRLIRVDLDELREALLIPMPSLRYR